MDSENEEGIKEMLKILKSEEPEACSKTQYVMTDLAKSFYNAWLSVIGPDASHASCSWHIERAWEKNIKIGSLLDQMKEMRVVAKETEFNMMHNRLEKE